MSNSPPTRDLTDNPGSSFSRASTVAAIVPTAEATSSSVKTRLPWIAILQDLCLYATTASGAHVTAHAITGGQVTIRHLIVGTVVMAAPFVHKLLSRIQTATDEAKRLETRLAPIVQEAAPVLRQVETALPRQDQATVEKMVQGLNDAKNESIALRAWVQGIEARIQPVENAMKETVARTEAVQANVAAIQNHPALSIPSLSETNIQVAATVETKTP